MEGQILAGRFRFFRIGNEFAGDFDAPVPTGHSRRAVRQTLYRRNRPIEGLSNPTAVKLFTALSSFLILFIKFVIFFPVDLSMRKIRFWRRWWPGANCTRAASAVACTSNSTFPIRNCDTMPVIS